MNYAGDSEAVSYGGLDEKTRRDKRSIRGMFASYFNKPDHPVRKMVYQFETKAGKSE
ncbi:hypothetical protein ACFQ3N_10345 [Virgibacillus byunsanensis]|uniref:Uncharacterized protein n=1 Tax=Virgibacillus byunsanensis TaxID=570945 RepID=A0ABW3LL92_9BACI